METLAPATKHCYIFEGSMCETVNKNSENFTSVALNNEMAIGSCPDFRVSYNLLLLVYWKKLIHVQKQRLLYPWQITDGSLIVVVNLNWKTVKMIKKDGNSFFPSFTCLFIPSTNFFDRHHMPDVY